MILNDLKKYVKTRQQVSLKDISVHFDVEPEAVKGMLDFWVNKGRITLLPGAVACTGGCSCSHRDDSEVYYWNQQFGDISIDIKGVVKQ